MKQLQFQSWCLSDMDVLKHKDNCYERISELGFSSMELMRRHVDLQQPEKERDQAAQHGLKILALHGGGALHDPTCRDQLELDFRELAHFLKINDGDYIACSGGVNPDGSGKTREQIKEIIITLRTLCGIADRHEVRIGYHNHPEEMRNNGYEFFTIAEAAQNEPFGICYDPCWAYLESVDPVRAAEACGESMIAVHLRDARRPDRLLEVGRGDMDMAPVLHALPDTAHLMIEMCPLSCPEYGGSSPDIWKSIEESAAAVKEIIV